MSLKKEIWRPRYNSTIFSQIKFELKSYIGRRFFRTERQFKFKFLNIGCGTNLYDNFVNADFYAGFKFWKTYASKPNWNLDLRYPLKCPSGVFHGIFTEHTLEHLTHEEVASLLVELNRISVSGATIRIIVPDLEITHQSCTDPSDASYAQAVWDLTQNWGHRSVWNYGLMSAALHNAGFINITRETYGEGRDQEMIKDSLHRKDASLYVEASKA